MLRSIEDKIPDITDLATNTIINANIREVKSKTPSITNLDTKTALNVKINGVKTKHVIHKCSSTTVLTVVENKIPNVSNFVEKLLITQKLMKLNNYYWSWS